MMVQPWRGTTPVRGFRGTLRARSPFTFPLIAVLAVGATAAAVFSRWPDIDTRVASLFYHASDGFVARGWVINHLRMVADWTPLLICTLMIAAFVGNGFGWRRIPAPGGRGVAFLVISLVLGPGLLVNVGLKDHAHRPRPAHLIEFGGTASFRPFYRFNGTCETNCSFVSGEVSTAAWTLAPALLVPQGRAAAITASFVFASAVALLRMAAGGHFLSDVTFAIVFTALVVLALHRLFYPPPRTDSYVAPDALQVGWPPL